MNKKILSALLLAAFSFASTSMFVSCKDYDDDIKSLQTQIDGLKGTLTTIQTQIQNGAILTSVTPVTGGVQITLSNGDKYTIVNGKDGAQGEKGEKGDTGATGAAGANGKDGTVWTIEQVDGVYYWFKDGVNQNIQAQGPKGEKGDKGEQGEKGEKGDTGATGATGEGGSSAGTGIYYVPNNETGCFDKYQDGKFVEHTTITFLSDNNNTPSGIITAVKTDDALTLYGVEGGTGALKTFTLSLNGVLKSLVFVPTLYLDGIEAIEYPWIGDSILRNKFVKKTWADLSHHMTVNTTDKQDIEFNDAHAFDYIPNTLGRYYDIDAKTIKEGFGYAQKQRTLTDADEWIYGPAWAVQYHLNPSTAVVDYESMAPKFNVLDPDVIYYNTRAININTDVTSPQNFFGKQTLAKVAGTTYNNKFWYNYGILPAQEFGVYGLWNNKAGKFNAEKEGILTAGIQIAHPDKLAPWPTDDTINPNGNTNSTVSYPAPANAASDTHPEWYGFAKYKYDKNNTDNTVALQLQNSEAATITSDYALLLPTRVQLEGLIWYKAPEYVEPDMGSTANLQYGPNKRTANTRYGDEEGWAKDEANNCLTARVHVWDSPEEAIADPDGAALELNCYGEGVDLTEYLGIHFVKENLKTKETAPGVLNGYNYNIGTWKYGDEAAFGLHYEFQFVDYYSSSNKTYDSRYATFSDVPAADGAAQNQKISKTGIVVAKNVDANQKTIDEQSTSSRDREPLVRVMVKNAAGAVLLDGYILLHINYTPDNLAITTYPEHAYQFDLCNPTKMVTTWAQFSKLVLTDALNGMEKLSFDDFYMADCKEGTASVPADDQAYVTTNAFQVVVEGAVDSHNRGYQLKIYNFGDIYGMKDGAVAMPPKKGTATAETALNDAILKQNKEMGNAVYYPNGEGVTNHIFSWSLSEEEIEALTHDKKNDDPVYVYRWIRFIAKDEHRNREVDTYNAPYPYVWVQMKMKLTRIDNSIAYELKDDNYWYRYYDADPTRWSGIMWDIQAPRNGFIIDRFNNSIRTTLVGNALNIAKTHKYYFAPKEETVTFYMTTRSKDAGTKLVEANPVALGTANDKTVKSVVEGFDQLPSAVQQKLIDGGLVKKQTRVITALNTAQYNVYTKKAETTKLYTSSVAAYNEGDRYQIYDQMFCKYVRPSSYVNLNEPKATSTPAVVYDPASVTITSAKDKHQWVENKLGETLQRCAVRYDEGVFQNKYLYSFNPDTKEYILIAKLNQNSGVGEIELIKDDPIAFEEAKLVLNAIGYPLKDDGTCDVGNGNKNIYKELRTWVGVVANNGCDVAMYTYPKQTDKIKDTDDDLNTFLVSWKRPVNTDATPISPKLDANTNENFINLIDYLKLYDWRGDKANQGYMYDNHYWFWSYYKLKSISIDMATSRVYTNLHYGATDENDYRPLNTVSGMLDFTAYSTGFPGNLNKGLSIYHFNLDSYNSADKETAIELFMGNPNLANPSTGFNANKQRFGTIYYQNNGGVLTKFDVIIPITIEYEWGWLTRFAQFRINDTHGN